ncbi:MAG: acyltransferase family protein [Cytophagaceae bacterium]
MNSEQDRIFGLDLIRALAIIIVVYNHSIFLAVPTNYKNIQIPFDGVDLFFVLSGFLIGNIIIKQTEKSFNYKDLITFWKRRWLRTLPLYYIILALNLVIANFLLPESLNYYSFKFLVFLQNFREPLLGDFFLESWSLCIEEWFYLLIPLALYLTINLFRSLPKQYVILLLLLTFLALITAYRLHRSNQFLPSQFHHFDIYYRKLLILRLDTILYGVIGSYIFNYHLCIWKKIKIPAFVTGIIILFFCINILNPTVVFKNNLYLGLYFSIISIGILMTFPLLSGLSDSSIIFNKPVTFISKISYSIYLIHLPVIKIIKSQLHSTAIAYPLVIFTGYLTFILLLSWISYSWIEKPFLALRDYKINLVFFTGKNR